MRPWEGWSAMLSPSPPALTSICPQISPPNQIHPIWNTAPHKSLFVDIHSSKFTITKIHTVGTTQMPTS